MRAGYGVFYDLKKIGQNYNCLIEKLEAYPVHWHFQGSCWIIITDETATQIRERLRACLDQNDELMVLQLTGISAWLGYGGAAAEPWMNQIPKLV